MKSVSASALAVLALSLLSVASVQAFGVVSVVSTSSARVLGPLHAIKGDDDFPQQGSDEYTGDVDWDAEWKKVVRKESSGQSVERPGQDFYKSDAEIAAIRAANKAQVEVQKVASNLPSAPKVDMQNLTGDWKFWIGLLAVISVASAVLSAPPSYDAISGGDSYYI